MTEEKLEELKEQIKKVAVARAFLETATAVKRVSFEKWEADNAVVIAVVLNNMAIKEASEARLRELTLQVYNETGNKKPADGVGVREVIHLEYDYETALNWAKDHRIALALDKTSFEEIAKVTSLPFVQMKTQPQATIAKELKVD